MTISIVIPTCCRPALLARLLRSIQAQTYRDYEIIVVDDYSLDQEAYQRVLDDFLLMGIRYFRNDRRQGASYSRNLGILEARNDLIALVDDDDQWLPNKLARQVSFFKEADEKIGLVYTWAAILDDDGKQIGRSVAEYEGKVIEEILKANFFALSSVLVRKKALECAGLFDEKLLAFQDWDMWTRIFAKGYTCRVVKSIEVNCWRHLQGTISSSVAGQRFPFDMYCHKHRSLYERYKITPQVDPYGRAITA